MLYVAQHFCEVWSQNTGGALHGPTKLTLAASLHAVDWCTLHSCGKCRLLQLTVSHSQLIQALHMVAEHARCLISSAFRVMMCYDPLAASSDPAKFDEAISVNCCRPAEAEALCTAPPVTGKQRRRRTSRDHVKNSQHCHLWYAAPVTCCCSG